MISVLELQILQVRLAKATASGILSNKQIALDYYLSHIGPLLNIHDSRFSIEAIALGTCATLEHFSVYSLSENVVDMHLNVAQRLVDEELNARTYELSHYSRAENTLFAAGHTFTPQQIYTKAPRGRNYL